MQNEVGLKWNLVLGKFESKVEEEVDFPTDNA